LWLASSALAFYTFSRDVLSLLRTPPRLHTECFLRTTYRVTRDSHIVSMSQRGHPRSRDERYYRRHSPSLGSRTYDRYPFPTHAYDRRTSPGSARSANFYSASLEASPAPRYYGESRYSHGPVRSANCHPASLEATHHGETRRYSPGPVRSANFYPAPPEASLTPRYYDENHRGSYDPYGFPDRRHWSPDRRFDSSGRRYGSPVRRYWSPDRRHGFPEPTYQVANRGRQIHRDTRYGRTGSRERHFTPPTRNRRYENHHFDDRRGSLERYDHLSVRPRSPLQNASSSATGRPNGVSFVSHQNDQNMVGSYEPFGNGLTSRTLPATMVSSSSRHEGDGNSVVSVTDSTNTGIIADNSDPRGRGSSLGMTNDGPGVRNTDDNGTSNIRSQLRSLEMRYIVLRDQMRAHGSDIIPTSSILYMTNSRLYSTDWKEA
jgi:hypothetical protein